MNIFTEKTSTKLYGSFWDIPGGDVKIPGGYINVFRDLYQEIKDRVIFGKEVTEINYEDSSEIRVKCQDGSEYSASNVIVTVALGYLKKHHTSLFKPELPENKVSMNIHLFSVV